LDRQHPIKDPSRQVFVLGCHLLRSVWGLPDDSHSEIKPDPKKDTQQLKRAIEFFPGTNIEQKTEGTNAFVTLVFVSCVLAMLYQSSASMELVAATTGFTVWSLY
jgi:hypothetical protein